VKEYRLNRMFDARSGRSLQIAVDHGAPGEARMLAGIEDMEAVIDTLVAAGPDALLLSVGQADRLQRRPGRTKPALAVRVDVPNVYAEEEPAVAWDALLDDAVGRAVRLDAACVTVNLLEAPGHPELRGACVANILALVGPCDQAGMPLMVEPLVLKPGPGGYGIDGDPVRLTGLVRQAVELGADVVKADPTSDPADYAAVVRAAGRPVLARGGDRVDDREILERTQRLLAAGARGVVYGRNVIQHAEPAGMVRALAALVHEGASAEDAYDLISADPA
jgi:DhnA family fructose-bisphosphate aldolase class Ia